MGTLKQKWKRVVCAIRGHDWATTRVRYASDPTKITQRTFCKRCGAMYHTTKKL